jgi:hypothetical protein
MDILLQDPVVQVVEDQVHKVIAQRLLVLPIQVVAEEDPEDIIILLCIQEMAAMVDQALCLYHIRIQYREVLEVL